MRKLYSGFLIWSDTYQVVQPKHIIRGFNFQILEVEGFCSIHVAKAKR